MAVMMIGTVPLRNHSDELQRMLILAFPDERQRRNAMVALNIQSVLKRYRERKQTYTHDFREKWTYRKGSLDQIVGRAGSGKTNLATLLIVHTPPDVLSGGNIEITNPPQAYTFVERMSQLKTWFETHKSRKKFLVVDDAGEDVFGKHVWGSTGNKQFRLLNKYARKAPHFAHIVYVSHDERLDPTTGLGEIDVRGRINTRLALVCPTLIPDPVPDGYTGTVEGRDRFGHLLWWTNTIPKSPLYYNDERVNTFYIDAVLDVKDDETEAMTLLIQDFMAQHPLRDGTKLTKSMVALALRKLGVPVTYAEDVYAELKWNGSI
jgi:hypothetical protein